MKSCFGTRLAGAWMAGRRAAVVAVGLVAAGGLICLPSAASAASSAARMASARAAATGDLYYVSGQYIRRRPVAGGTAHRVVKIGNAGISGMAKAGQRLFWVTLTGDNDSLSYVRLGSATVHKLVTKLNFPTGLVTVNGWLYWVGQAAIGRVRPDGTHLKRRFIALPQENGGGVADGLATDGHHLFFSRCQNSEIGRVNPDGSHLHLAFIKLHNTGACPQGLAVGNSHVYWTQLPTGASGFVGRATLAGSNANDKWLRIRTSQGPFFVAADNNNVYWDWGGIAGTPMHVGRARVNRTGFHKSLFEGQGALLLTSAGASV